MNMRGLLPSLGAGGSLIAAALCALVIFGGVLAFRDGRAGSAHADSGDLTLPAGAARARIGSEARLARILLRSRRAAAAAEPTSRPRARRRPARTVQRSSVVPRSPTSGGSTSTPRPATPTPPAPTNATNPAPAPTPTPPATTPTTGGTVEHLVVQTRATATPVVHAVPVPTPLRAPVEQTADTVEQVAATVDHTVTGLTGRLLER